MSEEKLYVIKSRSDDNFYFSGDRMMPRWSDNLISLFGSYEVAKEIAEDNNGQPVTFVEEPEKIVITKEQAEIVENAHDQKYPANYISGNSGLVASSEEKLLNAYVNGYTVAKEKKYLVYKTLGGKQEHEQFAQAYRSSVYPGTVSWILTNEVTNRSFSQFTEAEIEHYGLQDCEKEEVTDDGTK
ncbi:DUF1642 domain-containing protein [Lacticaseibacillus paracasei]